MNTLKLLPRRYRYFGLALILPATVIFCFYPEIILGDSGGKSYFINFFDTHLIAIVDKNYVDLKPEYSFFTPVKNNVLNEILLVMMVLGSYLVAFAKVKEEDEFTRQMRIESMVKALLINLSLLLIANFFVFGFDFLFVLNAQLFSYLLIFSIIFALKVRKQKKALSYEE
jgi:hypothetical protein